MVMCRTNIFEHAVRLEGTNVYSLPDQYAMSWLFPDHGQSLSSAEHLQANLRMSQHN